MKNILLISIVSVAFLISGCENAFFEPQQKTTDPFENFDYLWTQCDTKYSFFDLKQVDWDAVRDTYRQRLYKGMTEDSLFNVMKLMLNELRDDHTNLISPLNISMYNVARNHGQDNFDWQVIERNYMPNQYISSGPFQHCFMRNNKIAYIRYASFTGTIDDINMEYIMKRYANTSGMILDLRENGGGATNDVHGLLSRFTDSKKLALYVRDKIGPKHDEFSKNKEFSITPSTGTRYSQPVIMLVDRGTFSAGSYTSLATKAFDNITLMGDTTGGGLGLPNGGQLPNGWTYRFSITQTAPVGEPTNYSYENGVPVDVAVQFDWSDHTKDEILDKALETLLSK